MTNDHRAEPHGSVARSHASQGNTAPHVDATRLSVERLCATQRIERPGIYADIAAADYHADCCITPSLSSSIAALLLEASPRHAWHAHQRLNPDFLPDEKRADRKMEIGTAAHALLLGRGAEIVEIDADDYKTKAAQQDRQAALAAGQAPILSPDLLVVENMVAAAREQLAAMGRGDIFAGGASEAVLVWKDEAGPWCRAMLDHLVIADGWATIRDIKTSGTSINPNGRALGFKLVDMAYDLKASFYIRGLVHLFPDLAGRVRFEHIWIEADEPHSLVISQLDGASIDIGAKKAAAAIGIWHRCLSAGTEARHWPRYGAGIHRIEYPQRAESDWLEREMNDAAVAEALAADPFIGQGRLNPLPARAGSDLDSMMGRLTVAITFKQGVRDGASLLISIAGASGSGKTLSALKLARGLAGGDDSKIAVIDTEAGRARHYAPAPGEKPGDNRFGFQHADMQAPFTPEAYREAIVAADAAGFEVIVVDSTSHIWEGEGGVHDMHDQILDEQVETARKNHSGSWAFDEGKTRERLSVGAWKLPKAEHKRFVTRLLQTRAHLILCMRADEKMRIEKVKDDRGREKTVIIQAKDMPPAERWSPICEKRLPYEMTLSFVLAPDRPGFPVPIKLQEQHRAAVPLDRPLSEETGRMLAEWARGGSPTRPAEGIAAGEPRPSTQRAEAAASNAPTGGDPYQAELEEGREAARRGMEMLELWWKRMPPNVQRALKGTLPELKGAAAYADREIAEQPEEAT